MEFILLALHFKSNHFYSIRFFFILNCRCNNIDVEVFNGAIVYWKLPSMDTIMKEKPFHFAIIVPLQRYRSISRDKALKWLSGSIDRRLVSWLFLPQVPSMKVNGWGESNFLANKRQWGMRMRREKTTGRETARERRGKLSATKRGRLFFLTSTFLLCVKILPAKDRLSFIIHTGRNLIEDIKCNSKDECIPRNVYTSEIFYAALS